MSNKYLTLVPLLSFILPSVGLVACGGGGGDEAGIYTASSTAATISNGTSLSTTEGSGDGDPGDGDGDGSETPGDGEPGDGDSGPKLDVVGEEASADDGPDGDGCQKVDFLFIIDNSGSMLEEQDNLAASFPSFINTISSTLDQAQDYHIMVLDTDAWVHAQCPFLCAFPVLPGICVGFDCGPPAQMPEECEDILGAGVIHPKGANASNMNCNFQNGMRFMTDNEPNLVQSFQCAARVGTDSTDDPERPMEAMVNAVADVGPASVCNTGFLRDDAILVVTFVTDEDDNAGDGSTGDVALWHQALVDAKNGNEEAIVVLGLFGDDDLPNPICLGGAETSARLRAFLDSWGDKGLFGSICAADYDDFFQAAVDTIDTTCDEFQPPE
jgi:hypothetical protein